MSKRDVDLDDELNIVEPDATLTVGGQSLKVVEVPVEARTVTVREFSFGQSLRLEPVAQPMIESMGDAVTESDRLDWNLIMAAAGRHPDVLMDLLEASTGESAEYLDSLSDRHGRLLVVAFFKVNWDFFIDRLVVQKMTALRPEEIAEAASQVSSPH